MAKWNWSQNKRGCSPYQAHLNLKQDPFNVGRSPLYHQRSKTLHKTSWRNDATEPFGLLPRRPIDKRVWMQWNKQNFSTKNYKTLTEEWAASAIFAFKEKRTLRICVDYQLLNTITEWDTYPMPHMEDCAGSLGEGTIFSPLVAYI